VAGEFRIAFEEGPILPAVANRFQPAVILVQSIATARENSFREERPNALFGQPAVAPPAPKDMKAINDYYFGSHLTVTEVMMKLVDRVVGYLNDKLEVGRDGTAEDVKAGNDWRDEVLKKNIDVGSEEDFTIPKPGENGVTFRQVARMIESAFDLDALSQDRELVKMLEDMIGFRLNGVTVADLIESFTDPNGRAAGEVREAISEGLAGQTGSKAMQSLEKAAKGRQTVEQAVAEAKDTSMEEVDEETVKADLEAIRAAKTQAKVEDAAEIADKIAALTEDEPGQPADETPTDRAIAVIETLTGLVSADVPTAEDTSTGAADGETLPLEGGGELEAAKSAETLDEASSAASLVEREERASLTDALGALTKAYLEWLGEDDREPRRGLSLAI